MVDFSMFDFHHNLIRNSGGACQLFILGTLSHTRTHTHSHQQKLLKVMAPHYCCERLTADRCGICFYFILFCLFLLISSHPPQKYKHRTGHILTPSHHHTHTFSSSFFDRPSHTFKWPVLNKPPASPPEAKPPANNSRLRQRENLHPRMSFAISC